MSLVSLIIEALSQLRDVTITNPTNGQSLTYNSSTGKWINSSAGSSPLPAVRCYSSIDIPVASASGVAIPFDTNRFDQGTTLPQHSTSVTPSRLICRQAGIYIITGGVFWTDNTSGNRTTWISLNGVDTIQQISGPGQVAGTGNNTINIITTIYQLAVNDYVELKVSQNSGISLNILSDGNESPEFMMCLLSTV